MGHGVRCLPPDHLSSSLHTLVTLRALRAGLTPSLQWTVCFGFDVLGIWPPGYINPDINMVCRSPLLETDGPNPKQYVAAVDNNSGLMVLNYPAVVRKQPCHYMLGHSSHVSNVRWMVHKDEAGVEQLRLITAGGHDRALLQWKMKKLLPPEADDPQFRSNAGRVQDAKSSWYYKFTGTDWDGNPSTYKKAENVYKANEVLKGVRERALEANNANQILSPEAATADLQPAGATEGRTPVGVPKLRSDSAALKARQSTIDAQEKQLVEQQKLIDNLQAQLTAQTDVR